MYENNVYPENKARFLEKILSHLFFIFFTAQILSPYLNERTLYIELVIAIVNPYFIIWVKNHNFMYWHAAILWILILIMAIGHMETAVKLLMITLSVSYLFYAEERKLNFLKNYLKISIFMAILQFLFIFIDLSIARQLGPQNISNTIWGEYATATFTNFYTVFLFPRVSGLSREAGFFASLLSCSIFMEYLKNSRESVHTEKSFKILLWIGYILSFSKMSFVLFAVIFIEKGKNILRKIPCGISVVFFLAFMSVFWNLNLNYLTQSENVTFLHRFSAYISLFDLDWWQLLMGTDQLSKIDGYVASLALSEFDQFAGLGGFIIKNGILVTIACFVALYFCGITGIGLWVLFLLSINVQIDTNQNFIVLTYFLIFKYFSYRPKSNVILVGRS